MVAQIVLGVFVAVVGGLFFADRKRAQPAERVPRHQRWATYGRGAQIYGGVMVAAGLAIIVLALVTRR